MTVAIRAALRASSGRGHLSRCMALAESLRDLGRTVTFIAPSPSDTASRLLAAAGFPLHRMVSHDPDPQGDEIWPEDLQRQDAEESRRLLDPPDVEALVVDDYGLGLAWDRAVGQWFARTVAIDDFPIRPRGSDVIVDVVGARAARAEGSLLSGPRYALLRRELVDLRDELRHRSARARTVVAFLGAGEAAKVGWPHIIPAIRALSDLGHRVRVIGAPASLRDPFSPTIESLAPDATVADMFEDAALMICAAGVTALEAASLGVPAALVRVADNQTGIARMLEAAGAAEDLGRVGHHVDEPLASTAIMLMSDEAARSRMSERGRALIDGNGSDRVARAVTMRSADEPEAGGASEVRVGSHRGRSGVEAPR